MLQKEVDDVRIGAEACPSTNFSLPLCRLPGAYPHPGTRMPSGLPTIRPEYRLLVLTTPYARANTRIEGMLPNRQCGERRYASVLKRAFPLCCDGDFGASR